MTDVVILGGGVAGLSAAHHLVNMGGFNVSIYERQSVPGGKARSIYFNAEDSWTGIGYPAEHGFRFFPGFYRHVTATMDEIKSFDGGTVLDNLVPATEMGLARYDHDKIVLPARFPRTFRGFQLLFEFLVDSNVPIPVEELEFWQERVWQILTSCRDRRADEYERISWWDFIRAGSFSPEYRKYLANLTRTLVAAVPQKASTKTNGDILVQLLMSMWRLHEGVDRVLDGPTNEEWINPWLHQLLDRGVRYFINAEVESIECDATHITKLKIDNSKGKMQEVKSVGRHGIETTEPVAGDTIEPTGDYYISAVPVERMAKFLRDGDDWSDLAKLDTSLKKLETLSESTEWMNGLLFYLHEDVPIVHGHTIYIDAPWALTSISQPQFWKNIDLSTYGDGEIKGIISVDISDWKEGLAEVDGDMRRAIDCTPEQIRDVVWRDLRHSLNHDPENPLLSDYHHWFLDDSIREKLGALDELRGEIEGGFMWPFSGIAAEDEQLLENEEPLLVNEVDTWKLRPEVVTGIPNLFLAADYVRTYTDLATMEGANEAARRAVNAIMEASYATGRCKIWSLQEPHALLPFRIYDQHRYNAGRSWSGRLPFPVKIVDHIWSLMSHFVRKGKAVYETVVGQS